MIRIVVNTVNKCVTLCSRVPGLFLTLKESSFFRLLCVMLHAAFLFNPDNILA